MIFTLGIGLGVSGWIFIDAAAVLAARLGGRAAQ